MDRAKARGIHSGDAFPRVAGLAAVFVGALVVAGWALDIGPLRGLIPGDVPMKANAAVGILLLGSALAVEGRGMLWRGAALAAAGLVAATGFLSAVEHAWGGFGSIEGFLSAATGSAESASPRHGAHLAAAALALLASAFILKAWPRARPASEVLLAFTAIALLVPVAGHLFRVSALYGPMPYSAMAPDTALMLIVLCAAVWWSVPGGWLKRRLLGTDAAGIMTRLLLPFIVVGPLALGLLWVAGHWAGLYDAEFGWALFTVSGIAGSVLIVALVGRRLARLDAERAAAQASLQQVNAELERHATELTEANARLEVLSNRDALTGLWNRRAFDARLREEHEAVLRYSGSLALLILDVDHFKEYNDAFGHPAGDELLKGLASVLADHARGTDCVARIGGEEFAILLRATELDGAHRQAERLRTEIERLNWPNRPITVSIGVAATNGLTQTAYGLLSAADRALYEAKRSGRNRVRVTPAPAERAAQRG